MCSELSIAITASNDSGREAVVQPVAEEVRGLVAAGSTDTACSCWALEIVSAVTLAPYSLARIRAVPP